MQWLTRRHSTWALWFALTSLSFQPVWGKTLQVSMQACGGEIYCDIGSAMINAGSGDNIEVGAGIYRESLLIDKDLDLVGLGTNGVIIDANNVDCVIRISPGVRARFSKMSLRNGKCEKGGGVYNQGNAHLSDVAIENNIATASGGGVYNSASATSRLVLERCLIRSNHAQGDDELNVRYGGGGIYNEAPLIIRDSIITENRANENGGGIYTVFAGRKPATTAQIFAEQLSLTNNQSNQQNKTLARDLDLGSVVIDRSEITKNSSDNGGGIYLRGVASITKTLIESNRATQKKISEGGGIYVHLDSSLDLHASVITKNIATLRGGGIRYYSTSAGWIRDSSIFANEIAETGTAAGFYGIPVGKTVTIERSVLLNNRRIKSRRVTNCGGRMVSAGGNFFALPNECGMSLADGDFEYRER